MFLGVLSAIALSIGIVATAHDVINADETTAENSKPAVQVEQIQYDSGSDSIEQTR